MGEYVVEGTSEAGYVDGLIPSAVAHMSRGALGTRGHVEAELDAMAAAVRDFWSQEPDEVMRACSAYSARCTELYLHLHRIEAHERSFKQVRTQQVMPLLDELDRQWKNASRMLEVRKQDLEQMR